MPMLFADVHPTIGALLGLFLTALFCGAYALIGGLVSQLKNADDFGGLRYAIIAFGSFVWGTAAGLLLGGGLWILLFAAVLVAMLHMLAWLPEPAQSRFDGLFACVTMGTVELITSYPWVALAAFATLLTVTTVL